MGGGGEGSNKAPPGPDYTPIFNMMQSQIARANQREDQQWDYLKGRLDKNEPIEDWVIDAAIDRMERNDKWAIQDRQRYDSVFAPVEDAIARDALTYNSEERREQEAGKAQADMAKKMAAAREAHLEQLERYGVDPSQTRYQALDSQARIVEAAQQSQAGNQARAMVEQQARQLQGMAAQIGQGVANRSLSGQQLAQSAGAAGVQTGQSGVSTATQALGSPFQWFGAGADQTKAWGDLTYKQEANQIERFKAEQAAEANDKGSGFGDILGQVAGMGFKAFAPKLFASGGGAIPIPYHYEDGGEVFRGTGYLAFDDGGDVRGGNGGMVPPELSPSGGAIPDDIPATIGPNGQGGQAMINAGEFVIPRDVAAWKGQEYWQKQILKARQTMADPNAAPAAPTAGRGGPPIPPMDGVSAAVPPGMPPPGPNGAIPMMGG
jgi:hypothetical protein